MLLAGTGWLPRVCTSRAKEKGCGEGRVVMSPALQLGQLREMEINPVGLPGIEGLMIPAVVGGNLAKGLWHLAS